MKISKNTVRQLRAVTLAVVTLACLSAIASPAILKLTYKVESQTLSKSEELIVRFPLTDHPTIKVQDDNVVVTTKDSLFTVIFDKEPNFCIEGDAGIANPSIQQPEVKPSGSQISITGLRDGDVVRVYNINGMLVIDKDADNNGTVAIDISSMTPGVYILNVRDVKFKFIK